MHCAAGISARHFSRACCRGADVRAQHNGKTAAQMALELGFGDITIPHSQPPAGTQCAATAAVTSAPTKEEAGSKPPPPPLQAQQQQAQHPLHVAAVAADAWLWTVPPTAPPASQTLIARLYDSAGSLGTTASKGTTVSMGRWVEQLLQ